ncbi:MAG: hypothetical protein ACRDQ5_01625 [Sciscionella sp.]
MYHLWLFHVRGNRAGSTEGRLVNSRYDDDCLDVKGAALTDGVPVVRWRCGNNPNQVFRVSDRALGR